MTNAERFAIHGSAYKEVLRNTIQLLSEEILLQASPEGKNSLTQAIDLEDVDTWSFSLSIVQHSLAGSSYNQTTKTFSRTHCISPHRLDLLMTLRNLFVF
jgi:hypothetical protein